MVAGEVGARHSPVRSLSALGTVLELPEADLQLYQLLLGRPPLGVAELARLLGLPEPDAADRVRRLLTAGALARSAADPMRYRARHPQVVVGDRLDGLRRTLAAAQDATAELAELAADRVGDPAVRLIGLDRVRDQVADLADGACTELAVLARPELALPWPQLAMPAGRTAQLSVRTIWPDQPELLAGLLPAPGSTVPVGLLRAAAGLPPCGLVLVDGRAALVVSLPDGPAVEAVLHRHRGTVAGFVALFELIWCSARQVWPPAPAGDELTAADQALLGMLHLGLTDAAVANRLSVSVRTVGRRLEELMARLNARTRFQAGVEAARRGWL